MRTPRTHRSGVHIAAIIPNELLLANLTCPLELDSILANHPNELELLKNLTIHLYELRLPSVLDSILGFRTNTHGA